MTELDPFETRLLDLFSHPDVPVTPVRAFQNELRRKVLTELVIASNQKQHRSAPIAIQSGEQVRMRSIPWHRPRLGWIAGIEIAAAALLILLLWVYWLNDPPATSPRVPAVSMLEPATPATVEGSGVDGNPGFVEAWRSENLIPVDPFVQPIVHGQTLYRSGRPYDPDDLLPAAPVFEAIDLETGRQKWMIPLHVSGTPVVTDTTLYLTVFVPDPSLVASPARESALVALDAAAGRQLWSVPMGNPGGREDRTIARGGPWVVLQNGTLYATDPDGTLYAVAAETGTLDWILPTTGEDHSALSVGGPQSALRAGQLSLGDALLYIANPEGAVVAIDVRTQTVAWSFNVTDRFKVALASVQPHVVNGQLLIQISAYPLDGSHAGPFTILENVDPASGENNWSRESDGANAIFSVVDESKIALCFRSNAGEAVFELIGSQFGAQVNGLTIVSPIDYWKGIAFEDGAAYLTSLGGMLVEHRLADGTWPWVYRTLQGTTVGDPIVTGDLIIVQVVNGTLIALERSSPAMQSSAKQTE